jgi:hypothetical protein
VRRLLEQTLGLTGGALDARKPAINETIAEYMAEQRAQNQEHGNSTGGWDGDGDAGEATEDAVASKPDSEDPSSLLATGWEAQLTKLEAYKRKRGDCNVPWGWAEDPRLGKWISNQRAYKKNMDHGVRNPGMTAARAAKLKALGFVWEGSNTDDAGWEGWLAKLKAYKRRHGDCSVPQRWIGDPALGAWVMHQRKYKKALDHGESCQGMTAARVAKLKALCFAWELPRRGGSNTDDAGWEGWLAKLKNSTR